MSLLEERFVIGIPHDKVVTENSPLVRALAAFVEGKRVEASAS